jgi:hypothetical protein
MTKPLPCPFCGAEPLVEILCDQVFVSCPTVHLEPTMHSCGALQIGIARWNTRAAVQPAPVTMAQVRQAAEAAAYEVAAELCDKTAEGRKTQEEKQRAIFAANGFDLQAERFRVGAQQSRLLADAFRELAADTRLALDVVKPATDCQKGVTENSRNPSEPGGAGQEGR